MRNLCPLLLGLLLSACPSSKEDTGPAVEVQIDRRATVTWTGPEDFTEAGHAVAILDDYDGGPAVAMGAPGLKRVYVEPVPEAGTYVVPTGMGTEIWGDAYEEFGEAIAVVRDVTGDGAEDVAVVGSDGRFDMEVAILTSVDTGRTEATSAETVVAMVCRPYDEVLMTANEITTDDSGDLVVGCPGNDDGFVSLFEGPLESGTAITKEHTRYYTETETDFGKPVYANDMDGDGRSEVLTRSFRHVFMFHNAPRGDVLDTDAESTINGATAFGHALASGFDDNDDGYTDLLVSDPSWTRYLDGCRQEGAGAAWLYLGPIVGDLDYEDAAVARLHDTQVIWDPADCPDSVGTTLSHGDYDGDGHTDYAIGNSGAQGRASVYVVRGPLSGEIDLRVDDLQLETTYNSEQTSDAMATGDLDGDGLDDLIVADPGWTTHSTTTSESGRWGAVYLYPGSHITSLAGW